METGRTHRLPFEGDIKGVIGKDRFLFIIALVEADTPAVEQVYGRYYFYFFTSLNDK